MEEELRLLKEIPSGYYNSGRFAKRAGTWPQLVQFLTELLWVKHGAFNRTQRGAYLEWALQTAGFDTYIAVGPCPWGENGNHAWILVQLPDNRVAIEPMAVLGAPGEDVDILFRLEYLLNDRSPGVIYGSDAVAERYRSGYPKIYKNVYEAASDRGSLQEWKWWQDIDFR